MKIKLWIDGVLRNAEPHEIKALEEVWNKTDTETKEGENAVTLHESDTEYYEKYFNNRKRGTI